MKIRSCDPVLHLPQTNHHLPPSPPPAVAIGASITNPTLLRRLFREPDRLGMSSRRAAPTVP